MQSLPDTTDTGDVWGPIRTPQPDLPLAELKRCKTSGSLGWWVRNDGSTTTHPYICKLWLCEEHGEDKASEYVKSFDRLVAQLPSVWVGSFDCNGMDYADVRRLSDKLKRRAGRRDIAWVRVRSSGAYVYFAGGDLGPKSAKATSRFTEVTTEQASAMFAYALSGRDPKVNGSLGEPRWRSPDEYHYLGGDSGTRHIAGIPEGDRGDVVQRRIRIIAAGNLPHPVTADEYEHLVEHGFPLGGLLHNTPEEWAEALEAAGGRYKAERQDERRTPGPNGWPTARARHLKALPSDPDREADTDDERDIA